MICARGVKDLLCNPRYARRLRAAGIQVWDVALLRWSELRAYAAAHGIAWPFGSQASCLALFTQTWGENRMTKLNEMDGAGRDLMCSLPCFRRLVLNISVRASVLGPSPMHCSL